MDIIFREYKQEEKEEIKKLMYALKNEDQEEWPLDDIKIESFFNHVLDNHEDKLFVVEKSSGIIGYAILINSFSLEFGGTFTELDELYIKPEYRNQGIGTEFIKWLENSAKERGSKVIGLETTAGNTKAQSLYKKLGYQDLQRTILIKEL